jgi:CheY-like chemotaxis protein
MARILVIDDTRNILKMVRLTLEREGHTVETAEDGLQGLEAFGDGSSWDLTLVDQRMPHVEGDAVIVEARRRDPAARLVMMTAFATTELASQVLAAGALDFLRKPFSTDTLRGAIQAALARLGLEETQEYDTLTTEAAALPLPGQPGYPMPHISWRINGFSFWSVPSPQSRAHGLEFGRVFQVRKPDGELSQCFVGITPHIRAQAQREAGHALADDDPIWEKVCGQALLNHIWQTAQTPPAVLPVFDAVAD